MYELCGLICRTIQRPREPNISWTIFKKKILPQLGVINKNETFVQMKYNETKCI